jgi:hypothetical protein
MDIQKENPASDGCGGPGFKKTIEPIKKINKTLKAGMSTENDVISRYNGILPEPIGRTTWQKAIDEIRSDQHKPMIDKLRAESNENKREDLKKKLPSVTFSGTFPYRNKCHIQDSTGFITADIDHIGEQTDEIKAKLSRDPYVWFCFTSPSLNGLKIGLRAHGIKPIMTIKNFMRL